MAFQTVSTQAKYFKYAECTKGQKLVDAGVYKGTSEGKFGILHNFQQQNGETVVLNHAGKLDWLMENKVAVGQLVNVIYTGKEKLPSNAKYPGKEAHNFEVQVDNEYQASPTVKTSGTTASSSADISL